MHIKRWIVLSLAAALATLMLTGCPWDQDRPGGGASSQPGGDGVIVVLPGGDDDDDGGDDPPVTYTITAKAGPGGTAQPPSQTVTAGQDASVAVAASDGYCIQQITVDGDVQFTAADASQTNYTVQFPAVDASHTVEASFAQVYTVTASIGEGGTVKFGGQPVADGDSAAFLADDTLTFTVEPEKGWQIEGVTANGSPLTGTNGSYTYTVKGDCTIAVTFQKLTYTVTATVSGTGGKVSVSSEKVEHGGSVTVTVTPDEGYTVDSVRTADGTLLTPNEDGTYTLANVTEDQTITVTFQQQTYTVTAKVNGTGGKVSVSSEKVEHGGSVTVTVTPEEGYTVGSVQDNGADVTKQVENNTYTLTNVTADHDITVTFQKLTSRTVFTSEQLMDWAEEVRNGNYSLDCTLAADITLTGNWTPVGISFTNSYTGTFDGNNHTIRGLTVKGSDEYAGLFGYIGSGGTVKNVKLADVQITSDYQYAYVGGVAGNNDGAIENCSVSGSVSGNSTYNSVGGVVGYQLGGSITGCSSSATVQGTGSVGGVAGQTNSGATLTACYSTGNVTLESNNSDNNYAGGVVGSNSFSTLIACYATGNVTGTGTGTGSIYVGGVTGDNASGTLTACYHATGDVTGASGSTGGVTGRNFKDSMFGGGIITACYWQNDQAQGIGYNQAGTTDGTTKVDGDWANAVTQMNAALAGTGYSYQQGNPPKLN